MSAVTYRTRRTAKSRLTARIRASYLRFLIRYAEQDLARHKEEFERASKHLPAQIKLDRDYIAALTRKLWRADQET